MFSFEELFARELVKLSYSAHENFQMFDGHLTLDDSLNFLYYKLKNDDIFLSSIGDDTLKMIANYYNKYVIYSANWVFDDELKIIKILIIDSCLEISKENTFINQINK